MFARSDALTKELTNWVTAKQLEGAGPYLLRYHVIDMKGMMDIEVGVKVKAPLTGDDIVRPCSMPAGNYATLSYRGNGRDGHSALLEWIRAQSIPIDVQETPNGDRFGCRYEAYVTDARTEPRKLLRDIELSIRLRD